MTEDKRVNSMLGDPIFWLDGKRFLGYEAHAYLRDECGFSSEEAVAYLANLSTVAIRRI